MAADIFFIDSRGAHTTALDSVQHVAGSAKGVPAWYASLKGQRAEKIQDSVDEKGAVDFFLQRPLYRARNQRIRAPILHLTPYDGASTFVASDKSKGIHILNVSLDAVDVVKSFSLRDLGQVGCLANPTLKEVVIYGQRPFIYSLDMSSLELKKVSLSSLIKSAQDASQRGPSKMQLSLDHKYIAFSCPESSSVSLICAKSKRSLSSFHCNGAVSAFCFVKECIVIASMDRHVSIYSINDGSCLNRFRLEGDLCSALSFCPVSNYVGAGFYSGYVSVYDADALLNGERQPIKVFDQLSTEVKGICFDPSGNGAFFFSHEKRNAVRAFHADSLKVTRQWPSQREPLGYITAACYLNGLALFGSKNGGIFVYQAS